MDEKPPVSEDSEVRQENGSASNTAMLLLVAAIVIVLIIIVAIAFSNPYQNTGTSQNNGNTVVNNTGNTGANGQANNTQNNTPKLIDVTLTHLTDNSCSACNDTSLIDSLESAAANLNLSFTLKTVDYGTQEGKALVSEYNITKIPTIILSKEAMGSSGIAQVWPQIGTIESDGSLVYRTPYPPYVDLSSNTTTGLVQLIELNDSTCPECYNVTFYREFLGAWIGVKLVNITTYDVGSAGGLALVKKYNISEVPTVIVSPQINDYIDASPVVAQAWQPLAVVQSDGWYVVENLSAIGNVTYRDLRTNTTNSSR